MHTRFSSMPTLLTGLNIYGLIFFFGLKIPSQCTITILTRTLIPGVCKGLPSLL